MAGVLCGDCRDVLGRFAGGSFDACVTDPPYHLTSGVRRPGAPARTGVGFMGQQWDGGDVAFQPETWAAVARVMKPGAHLVAFGGTRTYHRLACAIEDAGFEIRDTLMWLYGSGYPKSRNLGKDMDALAGAEGAFNAQAWAGWGTALKPACEPIVLAKLPLGESSVARNIAAHGVGGVNIDGCRVPFADEADRARSAAKNQHADFGSGARQNRIYGRHDTPRKNYEAPGRHPANVLHDGGVGLGEEGRFFYCAKASKADREGNPHPTVKPQALMRWLCRLVTPPGGRVLDPFAGSGSTGVAAQAEGFAPTLIEQNEDYAAIARRRNGLPPAPGAMDDMG